MVNVQRFRARKVDLKRSLPVYRAADLDDLDDDDNRQVDSIETGVEKDEESEHHLQAAMSATHAAVTGEAPANQVYIPTPDASKHVEGYDKLYKSDFKCPKTYIRSSETVEECCAPLYCMDDEDVAWLARANKRLKEEGKEPLTDDDLETAMDQLETLTRDMVFLRVEDIPSIEYLSEHASERERVFSRRFVEAVFGHWKDRRAKRGFKPITPQLLFEEPAALAAGAGAGAMAAPDFDPYVCFRRREVRQGRKTRRADQRSLEQLRKMRLNLASVSQILESCLVRESCKLDLVTEAITIRTQRDAVLRMRRKFGLVAQSFDDLFVPPQQPQRKRAAAGAGAGAAGAGHRARASASRKPRIVSGLASAAATAAAAAAATSASAAGGASGTASPRGAGGRGADSPSFVLPKSITVHQHSAPKAQLEMAERIRVKAQIREQTLANWVDATFALPYGQQPQSASSTTQPSHSHYRPSSVAAAHTLSPFGSQSTLFWTPQTVLNGHRHSCPSLADSPVAFRLRRGRLGRVYLDRKAVRRPAASCHSRYRQIDGSALPKYYRRENGAFSGPPIDERLENYKLSLLTKEDHMHLRQMQHPGAKHPSGTPPSTKKKAASSGSTKVAHSKPAEHKPIGNASQLLPPELLKPFTFTADLLHQQQMKSPAAPGSVGSVQKAVSRFTPSLSIINAASLPELSITPTPTSASFVEKTLGPHTPASAVTMMSLSPSVKAPQTFHHPAKKSVSPVADSPTQQSVGGLSAAAAAVAAAATHIGSPWQHHHESSTVHGTANG